MDNRFVVSPMSPVFCLMAVLMVLFIVGARKYLYHRPVKVRRRFLVVLYLLALVFFGVYKYWISKDVAYHEICNLAFFTYWHELPCHPCNVVLLLMPLAMWTDRESLKAYCFLCSLVGPLLALLMPGPGFAGYSILLPRIVGYYVTHFVALMAGPLLLALDLYRPRVKDIPGAFGMLVAITFAAFLLSWFLRSTGMGPAANYFFTFDPDGNSLLELFRSWLPYPFLEILPGLVLAIPIFSILTLIGAMAAKLLNPEQKR